ncbi:unnamed protein product [Moneuplotes crassus]|uniref:Uncharacterized protein n=1 Tax=Euplotes crassus TaxID=5936 RepID=A0AAD2D6Z7_EUPCR|nr:unnamed protein product [Moneuplotes crassus]
MLLQPNQAPFAYKDTQTDLLKLIMLITKFSNIAFVILDIALLLINAKTFQALLTIFIAHSIVLIPSTLYHVVPSARYNLWFRRFAYAVGIFGLIAVTINYALIVTSEGSKALVYLFFLIILTFPGALISGSLIFLLYFEKFEKKKTLMLVPVEYMRPHQPMI